MNVLVWLRDARKGMTKKEGEIRVTVVCVHRDTDTQKKTVERKKSNNFCVRLSVCVRSMLVSCSFLSLASRNVVGHTVCIAL